jgi:chaperonin GroES
MNYEPLEDCVLVEKTESENDMSPGGIALPDSVNERPVMAKVLAVGPGVKLETGDRFPMTLNVGDTVLFPRKSGDHFLIDGKELIVIPERYILIRVANKEEHSGPPYDLSDTVENRRKLEMYADGELVPTDGIGNIIEKKE